MDREESLPKPIPTNPGNPSPARSDESGGEERQGEEALEGLEALARFLEDEGEALVEHLDELRWRLIIAIFALAVASVIGWGLAPGVLAFFQRSVGRLIFIAPAEAFLTRVKIALTIGLLLASPVALHQAWRFVLPALFPEEKRVLRIFIWLGIALFSGGIVFGFYVVYPAALQLFLSFGTEGLRPAIVVSRHLGFFLGTTLSFGMAFQLPVILLVLVKLNVLSADRLREMRKGALFLSFVAAGALTPADALSQVMMAVPLVLLYEFSIWVAPRFEGRRGFAG